jgi:hypothetical protein
MTTVTYVFPVEVFYQNEAIRSVNEMMRGFGGHNPLEKVGLVGDTGGITVSWESEDGKGLTAEANEKLVAGMQKVLDGESTEGLTFTVKKGVRQDES